MKNCSPTGKLMDSALNSAVRNASPAHQWRSIGASMSTSRRRTTRSDMGRVLRAVPSGTDRTMMGVMFGTVKYQPAESGHPVRDGRAKLHDERHGPPGAGT